MATNAKRPHIYDGEGDRLMEDLANTDRIILVPDARPSRTADHGAKIRLMWGQHLLDDLMAGRYRTLVCAVNAQENRGGIVAQVAESLPTSQWTVRAINEYAKRFSHPGDRVKVLKLDLDALEVLALLRPPDRDHLTMNDLSVGLKIVAEMLRRNTQRLPVAAVSFIGARNNALRSEQGAEPTLESVLRVMLEAGFTGDVYPAPAMWEAAPTGVYARYPFPAAIDQMRQGGF